MPKVMKTSSTVYTTILSGSVTQWGRIPLPENQTFNHSATILAIKLLLPHLGKKRVCASPTWAKKLAHGHEYYWRISGAHAQWGMRLLERRIYDKLKLQLTELFIDHLCLSHANMALRQLKRNTLICCSSCTSCYILSVGNREQHLDHIHTDLFHIRSLFLLEIGNIGCSHTTMLKSILLYTKKYTYHTQGEMMFYNALDKFPNHCIFFPFLICCNIGRVSDSTCTQENRFINVAK